MNPDRKTEIIDAAGKCFTKYGYDKTTLDDIGDSVGMNKVSLYYYFKNKEAILKEVVIREADEFSAELMKKVESIPDYRKKILAWIREGFRYNQANSILHQLSVESLKKLTPQLEELKTYGFEKGVDYLATLLNRSKDNGEIAGCDVRKAARAIQGVIHSMKNQAYLDARFHPEAFDPEAMMQDILYTVSLILDGIKK